MSATVNGITTPYLYDGQNPAMISSNQLLGGTGLDEIYAQINSGGATSYLRDGLNSTVAVTDSTATTTAQYAYSPYGDTASTGTPSTPLQYTGRGQGTSHVLRLLNSHPAIAAFLHRRE